MVPVLCPFNGRPRSGIGQCKESHARGQPTAAETERIDAQQVTDVQNFAVRLRRVSYDGDFAGIVRRGLTGLLVRASAIPMITATAEALSLAPGMIS